MPGFPRQLERLVSQQAENIYFSIIHFSPEIIPDSVVRKNSL
jgi:hypothetical protein